MKVQRSRRVVLFGICTALLAAFSRIVPAQSASTRSFPQAAATNALDPAKIKADELRLTAILSAHPEDPGALAGMGWVRSRQHNFPAAISFLERARQQRPHDARLRYALDSARFELMLQEGDEALKAGNPATAQIRYRSALQIRPQAQQAIERLHEATRMAAKQPQP